MMPAMSKLDREAAESVKELIGALAAARAEMRKAEQSLQGALDRAAGNESLDSFMVVTQPARKREALIDALEHVNQCRHRTRAKIFALALDRGYSVSDMARAWGISRQLASRYVKESVSTDEMIEPTVAGAGDTIVSGEGSGLSSRSDARSTSAAG